MEYRENNKSNMNVRTIKNKGEKLTFKTLKTRITKNIPNIQEMLEKINEQLKKINEILEKNTSISDDKLFPLIGDFSLILKQLLKEYFKLNENHKIWLKTFLNYYRQVQHYLIFLVRFHSILEVPHHSEIIQTQKYINNFEELIEKEYIPIATQQSKLFDIEFINRMEFLFSKFSQHQ